MDRQQTISDYVTMLQALLPGTVGLYCADRNGICFIDASSGCEVGSSPVYRQAEAGILAAPDNASETGRILLNGLIGYLFPLQDKVEGPLGVMTVLVEPGIELAWADALALLQPVVSCLHRELTLRFRLVTAYRKLNVRSAEENLLHQVEKLVHLRRSCEETLSHLLLLCRKFLQIRGAALVIPDKHVRLFEGDALSPVEAQLILGDMSESAPFGPFLCLDETDELQPRDTVHFNPEKDILALPVGQDRREPIGILALSGWEAADFSARRRRRIGRYLVAHIEDVIARDYDALTGLMSWQLFEARLLEAGAAGNEHVVSESFVFYCDIDQFHVINETLGQDAADELLIEFARLLRDRFGRQRVTRISGDTFAAVVSDTELDAAVAMARGLGESFAALERVRDDQTVRPSVSIGVALLASDVATASAALATAQVACKAGKDRGRGRVEVYQAGDASLVQRMDDIQLVGRIRNAIERARVLIMAQPIEPLRDGPKTCYFEILTRLINAAGEPVPPSEFFSAAERYQLMEELDRVVITETFNMLSERAAALRGLPFRFAINLSGQSLGSETFLAFVQQKLTESRVPAEMICFEITETVVVANLQRAQAFMHALKRRGCHFSLDDFGTGLSSFAYLKLFPVDTLKIDGHFIQDMRNNEVSRSVVAAISEVARVMKLETVAEYVEDEATYQLLCDLGVTYGQGFLLGEPEPLADRLDALISNIEARDISA